jgi:curved DNA-binding protein CbpA
LVKYYHPDSLLAKKDQGAAERIRQINAAYAVLRDPQARREYDRQLLAQPDLAPISADRLPLADGQPRSPCSAKPGFGRSTPL